MIITEFCTGCRACEQLCPKRCISMKSNEEGFLVAEIDESVCIGCGLCVKNCAHEGGVKVVDHLAVVNPEICHNCEEATCVAKCPTKAIASLLADVKAEEKIG